MDKDVRNFKIVSFVRQVDFALRRLSRVDLRDHCQPGGMLASNFVQIFLICEFEGFWPAKLARHCIHELEDYPYVFKSERVLFRLKPLQSMLKLLKRLLEKNAQRVSQRAGQAACVAHRKVMMRSIIDQNEKQKEPAEIRRVAAEDQAD